MSVERYFILHVMGGALPATAGFLLYGWRALAIIFLLIAVAMLATRFWRKIGSRGAMLRMSHVLWFSLLLALMLPAQVMFDTPLSPQYPAHFWLVVPGAAILLVMFAWLLGGVGATHVHPVLITWLALVALLGGPATTPRRVLQRSHLATGDLRRAVEFPSYSRDGWIAAAPIPDADAINVESPAQRLIAYTTASIHTERNWVSLDGLLRDDLPPLEDLIVGGQPSPIGVGFAIAVIVGGLFLLYRGVIDFRVPLFCALAAMLAFLILPIPLVETETGATWRWFAFHQPGISAATAISFANYELMAGPMLFTAFFLATSATVRPMARRAHVIYAILLGILGAAAQLYASVSAGPYLALLVVGLLTPVFDRVFRPKPLV